MEGKQTKVIKHGENFLSACSQSPSSMAGPRISRKPLFRKEETLNMKTKETDNYKLASIQRQKCLFRLKSFSLSQFTLPPYFMQKGGASWVEVRAIARRLWIAWRHFSTKKKVKGTLEITLSIKHERKWVFLIRFLGIHPALRVWEMSSCWVISQFLTHYFLRKPEHPRPF